MYERHRASAILAAGVLAGALAAAPANARIGEWVGSDIVDIRLVATDLADGAPQAAIEIVLEPGWKTYWRTPGEGGLPPVFDFSASRNLGSVEVSYPAPMRYNDGYTVTNVYEGRVILPLAITPTVDAVPVTVDVIFDLGVCETICIPLRVETSVTFSAGEIDEEALEIIEEGAARLPTEPVPGAFAVTEVSAAEGGSGFHADVVVPQGFGTELFVEGPEGWIPIPPHQIDRDGNRLTFAFGFDRPEGADTTGTSVTFTLVSGGDAIEQDFVLP